MSQISNLLLFCANGQRETAGGEEGVVVGGKKRQKEEKEGRERV